MKNLNNYIEEALVNHKVNKYQLGNRVFDENYVKDKLEKYTLFCTFNNNGTNFKKCYNFFKELIDKCWEEQTLFIYNISRSNNSIAFLIHNDDIDYLYDLKESKKIPYIEDDDEIDVIGLGMYSELQKVAKTVYDFDMLWKHGEISDDDLEFDGSF